MAKSGKPPIENAAEIIEKFGGIRPMASKTGVAVTTIQGWKKRGVIPGARKESVLEAAAEHEIDLSGLVEGAPSLEVAEEVPEEAVEDVIEMPAPTELTMDLDDEKGSEDKEDDDSSEEPEGEDKDEEESDDESEDEEKDEEGDLDIPVALKRTVEAESRRKATADLRAERAPRGDDYAEFTLEGKKSPVNRTVVIAMVIILVILAVLAGMVLPSKYKGTDQRDARIQELEQQLSSVKKEPSAFKGFVSENWSDELEQLKRQAAEVKKGVSSKVDDAKALSKDLASAEGITKRAVQLQTYVSEISGDQGIYALKGRFDKMRSDYMGEKMLSGSVAALLPLIQRTQGADDEQVNGLIANAMTQDKALQTSFGNVPRNELKAAAMLLAMTQVRSALNRPDGEFDSDLQLLYGMVDEEDTELRAAIEKLAPHTKEGVLTPGGLKEEFQSAAGEAVVASLRGEDVSVSDKLSSKFNELLKVEKDGELITGTETQATINTAEKMVENNQFEDAVRVLKSNLGAKELAPLRPWINKAEGMMASRKLNGLLEDAIEMNFGSGLLGGQVLESRRY